MKIVRNSGNCQLCTRLGKHIPVAPISSWDSCALWLVIPRIQYRRTRILFPVGTFTASLKLSTCKIMLIPALIQGSGLAAFGNRPPFGRSPTGTVFQSLSNKFDRSFETLTHNRTANKIRNSETLHCTARNSD